MMKFKFAARFRFTTWVSAATSRAARPLVRMAALQLVGIAGYSSSLRLALHPMGRTAHAVQLRLLGS
jgi:hypothetical protein